MLYKDYLQDWLDDKKKFLKYSTYTSYANIITNHIMPVLGNYTLEQLSDDLIQDYILGLFIDGRLDTQGGLSHKYVKDILNVIKLTLNRKLSVKLPYCPPVEIEIFEKDEQLTLINHLLSSVSYFNLGILLTINTGLRIGELCALQWKDINLYTNTLHINKTLIRTYTREDGSKVAITPPKSRSSNRTIPLNQFILHYISLFPVQDSESYILTGKTTPIEPDKYRIKYNRLLSKLSIKHHKFHCLRHTFATRCIEMGCDYKSVSEILGHSSVAITMSLYIHPQIEMKRKVVELLSDYYNS